ncbi:hypothetical protein ACHAQD_001496 [Fusarium lateritium]
MIRRHERDEPRSLNTLWLESTLFKIPNSTKLEGGKEPKTSDSKHLAQTLELLRLLTFEALEMRHTCCMYRELDNPDIKPEQEFPLSYIEPRPKFILNCHPALAKTIRDDDFEQTNARVLDTLMEEFEVCMKLDYQGKTVSDFIYGYWQQSIEKIYAVRGDEIEKMEQILAKMFHLKLSRG